MINGIQIVEIDRIKESMKNPKFLSRLFSPQELKFLMKKHFSPYFVAEAFCAKLAFVKAMGPSFRGCRVNQISVLADYNNSPYISLSGEAKVKFSLKKCQMTVSTSHSRGYATAAVTFFQNP